MPGSWTGENPSISQSGTKLDIKNHKGEIAAATLTSNIDQRRRTVELIRRDYRQTVHSIGRTGPRGANNSRCVKRTLGNPGNLNNFGFLRLMPTKHCAVATGSNCNCGCRSGRPFAAARPIHVREISRVCHRGLTKWRRPIIHKRHAHQPAVTKGAVVSSRWRRGLRRVGKFDTLS